LKRALRNISLKPLTLAGILPNSGTPARGSDNAIRAPNGSAQQRIA